MMILLFLLGLCVGSFLNVLIDRLPKGESFVKGRSHCDHCKHTLTWYELIPLLSFIVQGGKSRCCHKKLSFQYPLIELITGIGFVVLYSYPLFAIRYQPIFSLSYLLPLTSYLLIFCSFIVIFTIDMKHQIIPMEMIIVGIIGAAILQLIPFFVTHNSYLLTHIFFRDYLLPSACAFLFFFLLWWGSKGKAMGDGDMYLAFFIGLVTGFPKIIIALYAAFLTGAAAGVILVLGKKKGMKSHIPFGPFLIIGCVIALIWGDVIMMYWRSLW